MNVIEMLQNSIGETLVSKASSMLGENQTNTKSALGAALPALLGSIISKGSSNSGAQGIMDMISKVAGSNLNISGLDNKDGFDNVSKIGGGFIENIFGSKIGAVADFLGNFAGIKSSSATGLLSLAAPFLLGQLGKANGSNGVSGLMSLLTSQSGLVSKLLPSGLSSVLGLANLGNLGGNIASATTKVTDSYQPNTYMKDENKSGGMGWWPWLLAALAIALLLWALRGCNKTETSVDSMKDAASSATTAIGDAAQATKDAATATGAAAGNAIDAAKNAIAGSLSKTGEWVYDLGQMIKAKLPNGIELSIPEKGVENKLIGFISDAKLAVDKDTWFTMDRLLFETGKSTLVPSSEEQLKNVAAIMKAYPMVNIKLGGYTDNVGKPESNLALSKSRAESVMGRLVKMGIAANRLAAEGYGEQYPVADNTTPEGRSQNRRIDIRVTKK